MRSSRKTRSSRSSPTRRRWSAVAGGGRRAGPEGQGRRQGLRRHAAAHAGIAAGAAARRTRRGAKRPRRSTSAEPPDTPPPRRQQPPRRLLVTGTPPRPRRHPSTRPTSTPKSWCWARAPAATPRRSAPPISARRRCSIERYPTLGGVCLNVGCIPSKALLHVAKVISEAEEIGARRRRVRQAEDRARASCASGKPASSRKLTKGLAGLAKQRKVQVVQGRGEFASAHTLRVETRRGRRRRSRFDHCIIAAGFVGRAHSRLSLRRQAHLRFHRRARAARDAEAPAGHRRRHHRARDGDGIRRARQPHHGRRAAWIR